MSKEEELTLDKIIPQRVNANRHTQRGMGLLEKSMQERGWIGAITAAADGEIFDGSARRETIESVGLDDPIIIRSDGTRPIIHIREDIATADDPKAVKLSLEANWIASKNLEWEPGVLSAIAEEIDLSDFMFPHEIANLAESVGEGVDANELWKGMPEFENEAAAARSLSVHFPTEQDCIRFCQILGITITEKTKTVWYPNAPKHDAAVFVSTDES